MKHIRIAIRANEAEQEQLIGILSDYPVTGFEQTEKELIFFFEEPHFREEELKEVLEGRSFESQLIEEENWNAVWESNFPPVVVDDFCAVRAHFHEPIPGVEQEIVITPKMSFGTGHHATTYMMMQGMRHLPLEDKDVFDFGTGTGVLAILAEKLGAREVLAIDIDEWSIINTEENIARNNCRKIRAAQSSRLPEGATFDCILANINKNVILHYLSGLVAILRQGGSILFSGLLLADREEVVQACEKAGLKLENESERAGWIALLFTGSRV